MPIEPPVLDDLRYDAVVEDLVRRIPVYAPAWTDHNDSDPGITLIQLFAQLAEQIGYRLDRVPELAHLALLDLLGIRLEPAGAARTELALLLGDPASAEAVLVPSGAAARAAKGEPPPVFTTDAEHDLVPAEVRSVISTRNPFLDDVLALDGGTREPPPPTFPDTPADDTPWLSVRWDGRKPKPADLPGQPVTLVGEASHRYVWLALGFNAAPDAGFLGVRVNLRLQLDETEQPTLLAHGACSPAAIAGEAPPDVDWLHYWDAAQGKLERVGGRIDDGTGGLSRSGTLAFTVPASLGPIDTWVALQEAGEVDAVAAGQAFADTLGDELGTTGGLGDVVNAVASLYRTHLVDALNGAWAALGVPPALTALLAEVRQAILDRIAAVWPPANVTAVRDHVVAQVTATLSTLTWQGDIAPLFTDLRAIFLAPIETRLNAGGFSSANDAVNQVRAVITALDLGTVATQLHTAARDWVLGELAASGPVTVPDALRQDIADQFAARAIAAVDAVFGGAPSGTQAGAVAEFYRQAALTAIDSALANPPTAAITELAATYGAAIGAASAALEAAAASIAEFADHPLPPRYRDPERIQGWLRLTVPASWDTAAPRLRHAGFNVVAATNAEVAGRVVAGTGDGAPGLKLTLPHRNVLGALELAVQESTDAAEPLTPWREIDDLAAAGPLDRVYALDREAGTLHFGDGEHGRIPPLVPGAGAIVVETFRHGGGEAGNVQVGAVTKLETPVAGATGVVNIVAGAGGRDAEGLEQAKLRARRDIATRRRAVTAGDFEWIATRTPGVRVARAVALGLRRPLPAATPTPPPPEPPRCGPALPAGPTGLEEGIVAHGAVSVIVLPDENGPEPLPTAAFLAAVCRWLDQHRLVTTEVHVIPPQYVRLCDLRVTVQPLPGHTRVELQDRVGADLATHLHPLTGGDDGTGFPFGSQLHVADLIARIARIAGVDRVEELRCAFTRTKSNAAPREGEFVLCPAAAGEFDAVAMGAEETVSFDVESLRLTTEAPA